MDSGSCFLVSETVWTTACAITGPVSANRSFYEHCYLIVITNFTCTKICTQQTLVNLLVSVSHRCDQQGVFSVANAAPSKWRIAP
jgi:hypothetical protein